MAKTIEYQVSEKFLISEFVETGLRGKSIRTVEVPMDKKEVRQAWGELFGLQDKINAHLKYSTSYSHVKESIVHFVVGEKIDNSDSLITPSEAEALVMSWLPIAKAYQAQLQADKEAELAKQELARKVLINEYESMFDAGKFEEIKKKYDSTGFDGEIRQRFLEPALKSLQAQQAKIKADKEAEKRAWIETHGSDHLKRVYLIEGHNAQRIYVNERGFCEFGKFYKLDFEGESVIKECYNPSVKAVALLDEARKLGGNPIIGWQTAPVNPPDCVFDDIRYDEEGDYICREVVYIPKYLGGDYALIREV